LAKRFFVSLAGIKLGLNTRTTPAKGLETKTILQRSAQKKVTLGPKEDAPKVRDIMRLMSTLSFALNRLSSFLICSDQGLKGVH
jgi:hypothetical protein